MKVVILSGGNGVRLSEETRSKPKALVKIGRKPIIWHIINHYVKYNYNEFVIALGYKGKMIADELPQFCNNDIKIQYINTGEDTENAGRLKRLKSIIGDERFMMTWCDGLSDINIQDLLKFRKQHNKIATLTAVNPRSKYGCLNLKQDIVTHFQEKPIRNNEWINGGFFILEPEIFNYIEGDRTNWEKDVLRVLAEEGNLMAYKHLSFWQCMDTINEKLLLNKIWSDGKAKW